MYARVMDEDVDTCTREIETHFHEIPADTSAQWLDWSDDIPRVARAEAQRLVEDAGLLGWIGEQNSAQGVAPPPQFVWEGGAHWLSTTGAVEREALLRGVRPVAPLPRRGCSDFDSDGA